MVKQMLTKNLGPNLLNHNVLGNFRQVAAFEVGTSFAFNYPNLYVLSTRDRTHVYTLIINRELPGYPDQPIRLRLDNSLVTGAQMMTLCDDGIFSKNPQKTLMSTLGVVRTSNSESPEFQDLVIGADGKINIRPYSINIIKTASTIVAPDCVTIHSPLSGASQVPTQNLTVNWHPSQGAVMYRILAGRTQTDFDIANILIQSSVNSFTFPNDLPICSDVYIRVIPINSAGIEGICPPIKINTTCANVTPCIQLLTPQDGTVLSVWNPNITLNWLPLQNVLGYQILLGSTSGGSQIGTFIAAADAVSYILTDLQPCTQYFVTILPLLSGVASTACASSSFTTACPPSCTNILTPASNAFNVPQGTLITWDPVSNTTGYDVRIAVNGSTIQYLVGNTTQFLLPTQPNCEQITITVVPLNGAGFAINCPSVTFQMTCCINCQDLTITGTATWPNISGYTIGNSLNTVTVSNGATLTIPAGQTLEFCPTGQFILEGTGTVLLEGTLTSCGNSWLGTVFRESTFNNKVYGGALMSFGSAARIENAEIGLHFRRAATILLTGTQFHNNRISVRTHPDYYISYPPDPRTFNLQSVGDAYGFTNCTFLVDNQYSIASPFFTHALIVSNPKGTLNFRICKFSNMQDAPPSVNYGILTEASKVSISGAETLFNRLTYGIRTTTNAPSFTSILNNPNLPPTYPFNTPMVYTFDRLVEVRDAQFDHCAVGIHDFTSSSNLYRKNIFLFGEMPQAYFAELGAPGTPEYGSQVGIALENNVWGFRCTENKFLGKDEALNTSNNTALPDALHTIGTNMSQLGEIRNRVYFNEFYGLEHANISLGVNGSNLDLNTGLLYECNNLNRNLMNDFWSRPVLDPNGNLTDPILRVNHGTALTNPVGAFIPPANCFSQQGTGQHFIYDIATNADLQYFLNPNLAPCQNPDDNKIQHVEKRQVFIGNTCDPLPIPPGGGIEPPTQGLEWTPSQTSANRAAYFEAFTLRESSNKEQEQAYYTEKMHEYALIGYQAAMYEHQPFDSIAAWLVRLESYPAAKTLAALYVEAGNNDEASNVISQFEELHSVEIQRLQTFWALSQEPETEARTIGLLNLVHTGTDDAAIGAKSILELQGMHFAPIVQLGQIVAARGEKPKQAFVNQVYVLTAMPNPASENVQFKISGGGHSAGQIEIYSLDGRFIQTLQVVEGQEMVNWTISALASGAYTVKFVIDNKLLAQTQLQIIR